MRAVPVVALALLVASLLAPAAAGYAQPVFYFMKSGCPLEEVQGQCPMPDAALPPIPSLPPPLPPLPAVGIPKLVVADGVLDPYDFRNPNAPNSTEPDVKLVLTGSETVVPVRFVTPANHSHPDRIKGSFLLGLWTGESPVPRGNLTTTLYEVKADGASIPLANATVAVDLNASKLPDPATLVPPNPSDPMAVLYYELAQVLPLVLQPPLLFLLGPVDYAFDNTSSLAIGFRLTQGSSATPEPLGGVTLRFNSTLNPSFLYVPWYAPDPPRGTYGSYSYTPRPGYTYSRGTYGPGWSRSATSTSDLDGDGDSNGIPGLQVPLMLALVAVAAWAVRRRL